MGWFNQQPEQQTPNKTCPKINFPLERTGLTALTANTQQNQQFHEAVRGFTLSEMTGLGQGRYSP